MSTEQHSITAAFIVVAFVVVWRRGWLGRALHWAGAQPGGTFGAEPGDKQGSQVGAGQPGNAGTRPY